MRKLLIGALLVITSFGVQAQQPKFIPKHHNIGMRVPKPEQIIRKGDKVILIFDKNQYEKFRRWDLQRNRRKPGTAIGLQKRVEQPFIRRGYLERNPNGR
jgi:hypothetical protein